jgi:hypothetical protein
MMFVLVPPLPPPTPPFYDSDVVELSDSEDDLSLLLRETFGAGGDCVLCMQSDFYYLNE